MPSSSIQDRSTMITTDIETFTDSFAEDVDRGFRETPKKIPCIYFTTIKDLCFLRRFVNWRNTI